jgi:ribosomal silencing factor RsfS
MKNLAKIKTYIKAILVSKAMDDTLPMDMTQLDVDGLFDLAEACIKAEEFLNTDEKSIVDQVRAIVNEQEYEPTTIIDYIDGVQTIEEFEFTFTVKDFLEQIGHSN